MVHPLPIPSSRYQIVSSIEVPLMVDAPDWRTALCIGLQLLERQDCVDRLAVARLGDEVLATDPETGELYRVRHCPVARQRQAA